MLSFDFALSTPNNNTHSSILDQTKLQSPVNLTQGPISLFKTTAMPTKEVLNQWEASSPTAKGEGPLQGTTNRWFLSIASSLTPTDRDLKLHGP
jgi:hypothetical protein